MPRLPTTLFWKARNISPQGPVLLSACRDLTSATNELRWIAEHIRANPSRIPFPWRFWKLCEKRGRGVPLQYVLGTQPFGDLEIKCRPGVLIPRPETEAYTVYLAEKLSKRLRGRSSQGSPPALNVLDFCTGTGCIALQLYAQLSRAAPSASLRVVGIDASPTAVSLANHNVTHNIALKSIPAPTTSSPTQKTMQFHLHDIFAPGMLATLQDEGHAWDVMVSNPPYISKRSFELDTARAVRNWEPREALVPGDRIGEEHIVADCRPDDVFYAQLLHIATVLKPKTILLEVADLDQAVRVVGMIRPATLRRTAIHNGPVLIEIWRDDPGQAVEKLRVGAEEILIRGTGQGRSVYISLDET